MKKGNSKSSSEISFSTTCPPGYHLVRSHIYHVPPSKKNPQGLIITRHTHCAKNPPKRIIISRTQIQTIQKRFASSNIVPKVGALKEFGRAAQYDNLVNGWVDYWNNELKSDDPLDPNLVKALIASESSFKQNTQISAGKAAGQAQGLMQVTDQTLAILRDSKGELKNYLLNLSSDDLSDPSVNVCAGVRWLYQKKKTASARLKRPATWEEAVAEYKGDLEKMLSGKVPNPKGMKNFRKYYKELQEEENENKINKNILIPIK